MFNPTTIIILQLLATLVPCVGVLVFLLIYRRQGIEADLEHRRMRQEHDGLLRLQNAKQTEQVTAALQAFAPALAVSLEHLLAKRNKPVTAADLSDEDLVAELQRRVEPRWPDECPDCGESAHNDGPSETPIN